MKRKTLKLFACAAVMAMALSVTACGGSGKDDKAAGTEAADDAAGTDDAADAAGTDDTEDATGEVEDAEGATDIGDDAAEDNANAAEGGTLEELFSDPATKETFDSMVKSMESDGMSASVSAVGNEMIVEVKYEDSSMVTEGMGETLAAALDSQAETFKTQVKTLDDAIGQAGACTYTVRYLDPDGNVLAEKSFKAE